MVVEVLPKTWVLRLEDLTKTYSSNVLFQNLNLEIRPGRAIHVQGPNGSGKTQLMLVIAGLVDADGGQIHFREQREISLNTLDSDIRAQFVRYVPYLPGGLAEMPIDRALLVITRRLRPFSLGDQGAAAAKIVSELEPELNDIANSQLEIGRLFGNYSIGQQKRFMISASMGVEPYPFLMMLDEPLAGLDEHGISVTLELMRKAREKGIALLVSEHRKEILDFGFDSVLRLPYRPNEEVASSILSPIQDGSINDDSREIEIILRATNVEAGYVNRPVYCPSLTVSRGELVIIQGPNGSGKTGFIRGLLGYEGTTLSGQLEFAGIPVSDLKNAQRQSALRYLSQKRDLFPHLTVQESIVVASRAHKTGLRKEIADIVRFLGPEKLVGHLSSGGKTLIGLAQALAGGSKLLILDEPAATTDVENRQRVWELIDRACRQEGTAVLAIEHDWIPFLNSTLYQIQEQGQYNVLIHIAKNPA